MAEVALHPDSQGKVRDLYDLGDELLIVATDRISAYDYILEDDIPYKGEVLTRLSLFWFDLLSDIIPNHLISADVADLPERFAPQADYLDGRFMLVHKARMFPVECIVRGYLAGSGLKEYQASGTVCGIEQPPGLVNSSKFEHPLYTPSTKAAVGDHDQNVTYQSTEELVGKADAEALRTAALAVYERGAAYAAERGIIIADTKLEFGMVGDTLTLCDEVLTPDSSRFWPADEYEPGRSQASFDKQFVRDWLDQNWDRSGKPPRLPDDIIEATSRKYIQAFEIITGTTFSPVRQP